MRGRKLVDGLIPSGTVCPFLKDCNLVDEHCPSEDSLKVVRYNCSAARAHDLLQLTDIQLLHKIIRKPKEV